MQHSTSVWMHIIKANHTPNSTVLVLFKALCTLDLKQRGTAKGSNCAQIHALCKKKLTVPDTKVWIVHNVHNSVSCIVVSMKFCRAVPSALLCRLFFTIYPYQKKKQKHPKCDIFSVISVPVCRTRPTKIRISVRELYPKLRIIKKNGRFHDTPLQLVQKKHRFDLYAIDQVMLSCSANAARKLKTWWKTLFRCYLRLSAQRTSNQDDLLRDPYVSKVTHYPQITKCQWPTSRMCTALPGGL